MSTQKATPIFVNRYFYTRTYVEMNPTTNELVTRSIRDVGIAALNATVVEVSTVRTREEKDEALRTAGRNRRGPVGYTEYITGTVKVDRGGLVRFTAFDEAKDLVENLQPGDSVDIIGTTMGNQRAGIKAINVINVVNHTVAAEETELELETEEAHA